MEEINIAFEFEKERTVNELYYSLVRLQTEAMKYVARGENDEDKVVRAKSVIEQVQETIKIVEETGVAANCDPPCRWDNNAGMCICAVKFMPLEEAAGSSQ